MRLGCQRSRLACALQSHVTLPKSVADSVFADNEAHMLTTLVHESDFFSFATRLVQDVSRTLEPVVDAGPDGSCSCLCRLARCRVLMFVVCGRVLASAPADAVNVLMRFGIGTIARSTHADSFPAFASVLSPLFKANPVACRRFLLQAVDTIDLVLVRTRWLRSALLRMCS